MVEEMQALNRQLDETVSYPFTTYIILCIWFFYSLLLLFSYWNCKEKDNLVTLVYLFKTWKFGLIIFFAALLLNFQMWKAK